MISEERAAAMEGGLKLIEDLKRITRNEEKAKATAIANVTKKYNAQRAERIGKATPGELEYAGVGGDYVLAEVDDEDDIPVTVDATEPSTIEPALV